MPTVYFNPEIHSAQFYQPAKLRKNLIGKRFRRLLVLEFIGKTERPKKAGGKRWRYFYKAICDCGNVVVVEGDSLRCNTNSCGCYRTDMITKHGLWKHSEYQIWAQMKQRCNNPSDAGYCQYGGRGITVCDRWRKFENFYADVGPRPSPKHTLDRIDNNKGYFPENCRWAPRDIQLANRRTTRWITFNGQTKSMAQWAKQIGLANGHALDSRLKRGWSLEEALTRLPSTKKTNKAMFAP